jgi:hypothetical protein
MAGLSRPLAIAATVAVAVVVVVGLWLWRGDSAPPAPVGPQRAAAPEDFRYEEARLVSPDLKVKLTEIFGTVHNDYTDWACILECRDQDGCHADVQLVVEYRSAGEKKKLILGGRLDADSGQMMRIGRAQRPPVAVDSIDRVTLTVIEPRRSDSPRPTEIE